MQQPTSALGLLQRISSLFAIKRRDPRCPSLHLSTVTASQSPSRLTTRFAWLVVCHFHEMPRPPKRGELYRIRHLSSPHTGPIILLRTLLLTVKRSLSILEDVQVLYNYSLFRIPNSSFYYQLPESILNATYYYAHINRILTLTC